jgi:hypothetical protein
LDQSEREVHDGPARPERLALADAAAEQRADHGFRESQGRGFGRVGPGDDPRAVAVREKRLPVAPGNLDGPRVPRIRQTVQRHPREDRVGHEFEQPGLRFRVPQHGVHPDAEPLGDAPDRHRVGALLVQQLQRHADDGVRVEPRVRGLVLLPLGH